MPVKTKIMTHLKVNQTTSSETCWMCWSLNWNLRIAYHLASRAHRYWFREVQSTPEQLHREKQGKFSDFAARYWHNDVPLLETGAIGFCGSAGICGLLGTPWPDHHLPPEKPYGVGSQRTLAEYEGAGSRRHWFSNGILYIFPRKRASRVTYMSRGTWGCPLTHELFSLFSTERYVAFLIFKHFIRCMFTWSGTNECSSPSLSPKSTCQKNLKSIPLKNSRIKLWLVSDFAGVRFADCILEPRATLGGQPAQLFAPLWADEQRVTLRKFMQIWGDDNIIMRYMEIICI